MAVVSFTGYRPAPRYDDTPWTEIVIEEGASSAGPWTEIDTIVFDDPDEDPTNPVTRNFTTLNASGDPEDWYRLTFGDDDGNTQPPILHADGVEPWISVAELALLLRTNATTYADQLERVLTAAAGEIQEEIGPTGELTGWRLELAAEVNLERAVEHWQQQQSPFGILLPGGDFAAAGPAYTSRDTWDRHAAKLAPLKTVWGIAEVPTPPLTDLMDEMAATIEDAILPGIVGLQVIGRQNDNPTPPSIDIYPGDPFAENGATGFNSSIGAWIFTVRARVIAADQEGGQDLLLAMMDDEHELSVATALLDDQTLNGLATSIRVEGPSGYVPYGSHLGCWWRVTVLRDLS